MIFTDLEHKKLIITFKELIGKSHTIKIVSPFITKQAFNLFYDEFESFFSKQGKLQILTTTYNKEASAFNINDLQQINNFPNTEIKVQVITNQSPIHMKVYVFETNEGVYAISGSSNMTNKGLTTGEINFSFVKNQEADILNQHFNYMWNDEDKRYNWVKFTDLNPNDFEKLQNQEVIKEEVFTPLPYQAEVIKIFKQLNQPKNLIVLPTGTGKTYLAAFLYKAVVNQLKNPRILFISHRQEIVANAKLTFEKVLKLTNTSYIKGGWVDPGEELKTHHLFIVDKSLNNLINQQKLNSDDFDMIYFDEAHHLDGESDTNVIAKIEAYFQAPYKVALTATPERSDRFNIKTIFGEPIYEMRLSYALEHNLVAPLNYFLINDASTNLDNQELNNLEKMTKKINTPTRNNLILETINKRISMVDNNCVIFCSTIEHATTINNLLIANNYKSNVITSVQVNSDSRTTILQDFIDQRINFLCVVDILNEGVDIPVINNVILARPTNSSTIYLQQLGRGLRKYPDKVLNVFDLVANINNDSYWYNRIQHITNLTSCWDSSNYLLEELVNVNLVYDQLSYQTIMTNLAAKWACEFNEKITKHTIRKTKCYDYHSGQELVLYYLFNDSNADNCWTNLIYHFKDDEQQLFDDLTNLEQMDLRSLEPNFIDLPFFNFMKQYQDHDNPSLSYQQACNLVVDYLKTPVINEHKLLYNFNKLVNPQISQIPEGEVLTRVLEGQYLTTVIYQNHGCLLTAGSHFKPYGRKKYSKIIRDLWEQYSLEENLVDKEKNIFRMTEDVHFESTDLLVQFVIGGTASFIQEFVIQRLGISISDWITERAKEIIKN